MEKSYYVGPDSQHSLQQISSQFQEALRLELNQNSEIKVSFKLVILVLHLNLLPKKLLERTCFGVFGLQYMVCCVLSLVSE